MRLFIGHPTRKASEPLCQPVKKNLLRLAKPSALHLESRSESIEASIVAHESVPAVLIGVREIHCGSLMCLIGEQRGRSATWLDALAKFPGLTIREREGAVSMQR
jgi:hypothetical protein